MKTIKENIAPQITHLFNSIIRTSTMPDIFKISKILPIGKPNKPTNNIESFRPINNLVLIEKLFEEYWKQHFENYLSINNIINQNHHVGYK